MKLKNSCYPSCLIALLLFLIPIDGFGQAKKAEITTTSSACYEIESIVKEIVTAASRLENPANINLILSHIDTSYKEEKILMGIDEDAKILRENYQTFKQQCERFIDNTQIGINYNLKKILKSDCGERLSYCIHETEFTISRNGKVAYKGNQIRTFYFFKRQGKWKIFKAQTIETRTEIYNLDCDCKIEKKYEGSYNVSIKLPKGHDYETKTLQVTFNKLNEKYQKVQFGDAEYIWENGKVFLNNLKYNKDNPGPAPIKAATEEKVISALLLFTNKQNCSEINIKTK